MPMYPLSERQLAPRFAARQTLMATKEAKRVVRIYNRVARALIEFETLWQQAWLQSLEVARAGLQATLIVAHPDTGDALQACAYF